MERIAAGNVITSSSVRPADNDDRVSGNISVDANSSDNAVYMVNTDRNVKRNLSLIPDLRADSRCYEQRREHQYNFFHIFYEVYSR